MFTQTARLRRRPRRDGFIASQGCDCPRQIRGPSARTFYVSGSRGQCPAVPNSQPLKHVVRRPCGADVRPLKYPEVPWGRLRRAPPDPAVPCPLPPLCSPRQLEFGFRTPRPKPGPSSHNPAPSRAEVLGPHGSALIKQFATIRRCDRTTAPVPKWEVLAGNRAVWVQLCQQLRLDQGSLG